MEKNEQSHKCRKKFHLWFWGLPTGFLNGLLGAGGGMVVVPVLEKKLTTKEAHATSVAIILPLCAVSAVLYLIDGRVTFADAAPFLLWGAVGSAIGTFLLFRLKGKVLRKLFALLILWAAVRLLLR